METSTIVAVVIALVSGGGGVKLLELVRDSMRGITGRKRDEVDAVARQLTQADERRIAAEAATVEANTRRIAAEASERAAWAAERDTATRLRKCAEVLSATRRVALDHGIPTGSLPETDF